MEGSGITERCEGTEQREARAVGGGAGGLCGPKFCPLDVP